MARWGMGDGYCSNCTVYQIRRTRRQDGAFEYVRSSDCLLLVVHSTDLRHVTEYLNFGSHSQMEERDFSHF